MLITRFECALIEEVIGSVATSMKIKKIAGVEGGKCLGKHDGNYPVILRTVYINLYSHLRVFLYFSSRRSQSLEIDFAGPIC